MHPERVGTTRVAPIAAYAPGAPRARAGAARAARARRARGIRPNEPSILQPSVPGYRVHATPGVHPRSTAVQLYSCIVSIPSIRIPSDGLHATCQGTVPRLQPGRRRTIHEKSLVVQRIPRLPTYTRGPHPRRMGMWSGRYLYFGIYVDGLVLGRL
jgi:hypothetical protein